MNDTSGDGAKKSFIIQLNTEKIDDSTESMKNGRNELQVFDNRARSRTIVTTCNVVSGTLQCVHAGTERPFTGYKACMHTSIKLYRR